ncbi:SDR family NAD(P)-dependent oxidoreductase [Phenylobacterium aquaticum]|uniref:SDR family NAD(P)-dependent oxidoreductase n=1 Tax=Phenylobacterium aquaticum TaxID=1763816 RepID=UPI0026ED9DB8|nr:SDR family NAD(P)-dependent oxidoreductase [Phenylobacterium aquaticum]
MALDKELDGRVAIVTGASRGIGRAIAARLAEAGARLVLTGRTAADVKDAAAAIVAQGGEAVGLAADTGDSAAWSRVVETAQSRFGGLDILVANAGVTDPAPIADMTLDAFRALQRTNLRGCFLGLRAAATAMIEQGRGGSVILVGSIVGKVGAQGHAAYAAAKDGVRLMAKAAALELGDRAIRVNSLHPGMIRTRMTAGYPEDQMAGLIPLGRFGEPREVAGAAAFLASDRARFMTGAELVVDGGWIAQ